MPVSPAPASKHHHAPFAQLAISTAKGTLLKRRKLCNKQRSPMAPTFWQKATVQSAIISGGMGVFAVLGAVLIPSYLEAPKLREENIRLQKELEMKAAEMQNLEIEFTPFKTIALDKFTGTEAERLAKLALMLHDLQASFETLSKYQDMARLGPAGLTGIAEPPLIEHTPINTFLQGTYSETADHHIIYRTTADAMAKYQQVIDRYPDFPFAYYGMAICLSARHDPRWKAYAEKGVAILERTSSLPEHQAGHDECLTVLRAMLNGEPAIH
jgi:hypothetical protein